MDNPALINLEAVYYMQSKFTSQFKMHFIYAFVARQDT